VRTGKIKVFRNDEIGPDAVLASACLPLMFQAVEIDGEHYWDGGYMGNPPIFPLIYGCDSRDVVIVHINPLRREAADDRERDHEPHQRNQLQFRADARDARGRLRHQADR
jgi:predicted acylesterase/phospholipase RssA